MHKNSMLLFDKYAKQYFCNGMSVLEVGPDKCPSTYYDIVGKSIKWDTADIKDLPPGSPVGRLFKMSDPYVIQTESDQYDIVITGQVIEQVHRVWDWVKELARVCKPGGKVIIINPISWPNESPVDAWRIYPPGMKALFDNAGLTVDLSVYESLDGPDPKTCVYCGTNPGGVVDCISIATK